MHHERERPSEPRECNLASQWPADRETKFQTVPELLTLRCTSQTSQRQARPDTSCEAGQQVRANPSADTDQNQRGKRQLVVELLENVREYRDDLGGHKDANPNSNAPDDDWVHHGGADALPEPQGHLEVAGHPVEDLRQ